MPLLASCQIREEVRMAMEDGCTGSRSEWALYSTLYGLLLGICVALVFDVAERSAQ